MPPLNLLAARDTQFVMAQRVALVAPVSTMLPIFSGAEAAKLVAAGSAASEDGRHWSPVQVWLDRTATVVQCRRTGLVIVQPALGPPSQALLPLHAEPIARLTWKSGSTTNTKPLVVMTDLNQRQVKLCLPFEATPEGRELFGAVVSALTTPASEPTLEITCEHTFLVRVPGPPVTPQPTPGPLHTLRPDRLPTLRPQITRIIQNPRLTQVPLHMPMVVRDTPDRTVAAATVRARPLMVDAEALMVTRVIRTDVVFRPVPTGEPTIETRTLASTFSTPVLRPRDDVQAFPDLPRQAKDGWGQVPGREGKPPLHFRDAGEPDSFLYLPTAFKLGFGGDGVTARPPMRAEIYLDSAGAHRVRVTLVALPFIEEADRDALRRHLKHAVLSDTVSFVRLSPASGMRAQFLPDFSAGSGSGTVGLPAGISFTALEVAPDKWLLLQFDMEAGVYGLFCELLSKGIRGRVVLEAAGVTQGVSVFLDLDNILSDAVKVTLANLELSVENAVELPARLSSLRAALLDTGPVPGLVFDVEEQELVPEAGQPLQPLGKWHGKINPQHIKAFDEAVLSIGAVSVESGGPQAWLDRVNRDPSLRPQPLKVRVSLTTPALFAAQVELVQVRLRREGESLPRQEHRLTPGAGPLELAVDLTLAELTTVQTATPPLFLEYETLQKNGRFSLAQRTAIRVTQRDLVILALADIDDGIYTVDAQSPAGATREDYTRERAVEVVRLLAQIPQARWQVYVRRDATPAPTATPPPTPAPTPTVAPTGQAITIVTDLIAPALADGTLTKVFVVLQAAAVGSPSSTLVFEQGRASPATWRPTSGTVPPYKFVITYQLAQGLTKRVEGTDESTTLLIDWPLSG